MNTTTFYLVRHGQTEWNRDKKMQGWQDSPLTAEGVAQAQDAGLALEGIDFAAACGSPTGRARRTLDLILAHYNEKNRERLARAGRTPLMPTHHDGLRELGLGEWEGSSYADDRDGRNPDPLRHDFWFNPGRFVGEPIAAEDFQTVTTRVLNPLETLAAAYSGQTILVLSHTIAIRSVLNYFLQLPVSAFWLEPSIRPCGISILHWRSRTDGEVLTYGDKVFGQP